MQKHHGSKELLPTKIALGKLEQELSKIRKRKIKKIRRKIHSGGYQISNDELAAALCYLSKDNSTQH